MKYVSIDIETSGLDCEKNKILSFGAIIEDTNKKLPYNELPKFHTIIIQREIVGSPRALGMNSFIISTMANYLDSNQNKQKEIEMTSGYYFIEEKNLTYKFSEFLKQNGFDYVDDKPITINVAGKNFGTFDKLFLEKIPSWNKLIRIRQRIIDPSVLFCKWLTDDALPSLSDCKIRGQINGEVTHDALEDAWDVIQLLRKFY